MTSLEIIEKLISVKEYDLDCEMATEYGSQEIIDILEQDIKNLQQIKQDLEKYNKVMKLLKSLFNEIDIGYNFDCDREPAYEYEMYFNDNGGTDRCINEDLYMILLKLYQMVGDSDE